MQAYRQTRELWTREQLYQQLASRYDADSLAIAGRALEVLDARGMTQISETGLSCEQFGLRMAAVLMEEQADMVAIAAALLFELFYNELLDYQAVAEAVSSHVAAVLAGVSQLSYIRTLQNARSSDLQLDRYRCMLLAMVEDARIVLVKLAERLCLMRLHQHWSGEYRLIMATEILEIYAPLASRLGLYRLKCELEDKALWCQAPERYQHLEAARCKVVGNGEQVLSRFQATLKSELAAEGIRAGIYGRMKHLYSIWRKMQKKNYRISQLYDLLAVRILVNDVPACYRVLSVLQTHWENLNSEYADYISNPKPNGYQSLHIVVRNADGIPIEVQIRTKAMHTESETGVAAHWRYKEGAEAAQSSYQARIAWLRALLDWQKGFGDQTAYASVKELGNQVADERVYTFTPAGEVIDLPRGSTPLDFAYHVHTQVGHRCKGAKVNGRIVPLTHKLETGDQVYVMTNKLPNPSRDWMSKQLGYVHSRRIRHKIARWFKLQDKQRHARIGRERLQQALKGRSLKPVDYTCVAARFNRHDTESLYAGIYSGDVRLHQVAHYILAHYGYEQTSPDVQPAAPEPQRAGAATSDRQLVVYGMEGLMTHIAGCCQPVAGDPVAGYVTAGGGVSVHRTDCSAFTRMQARCPDKVVPVQWQHSGSDACGVDLRVCCVDAHGLSEFYGMLAAARVKVLAAGHQTQQEGRYQVTIRVAVHDRNEVTSLLTRARSLKNVIHVERCSQGKG